MVSWFCFKSRIPYTEAERVLTVRKRRKLSLAFRLGAAALIPEDCVWAMVFCLEGYLEWGLFLLQSYLAYDLTIPLEVNCNGHWRWLETSFSAESSGKTLR